MELIINKDKVGSDMVFKENILVNAFLCGIQDSKTTWSLEICQMKVNQKNYCIIYFNIKTASISEISTKNTKHRFLKKCKKQFEHNRNYLIDRWT